MNLPNALSVTRICLVPLLVVVLLTKFEGRQILGVPTELVGAAIFGLASLTDWADGYLARRRKQITPFGQYIDPLADKLLTLAAFVSLVQMDLAPAWMVAEVVAILALILAHGQTRLADFLYWTGQAALWFVVVTALVSAADYFKRFNVIVTPRVADIRDRRAG